MSPRRVISMHSLICHWTFAILLTHLTSKAESVVATLDQYAIKTLAFAVSCQFRTPISGEVAREASSRGLSQYICEVHHCVDEFS